MKRSLFPNSDDHYDHYNDHNDNDNNNKYDYHNRDQARMIFQTMSFEEPSVFQKAEFCESAQSYCIHAVNPGSM